MSIEKLNKLIKEIDDNIDSCGACKEMEEEGKHYKCDDCVKDGRHKMGINEAKKEILEE